MVREGGKYLLMESIANYCKFLHGSSSGTAGGDVLDYNEHRARKTKLEADQLERKAQIEKFEMLPRKEYGELIQAALMVQKRELAGLPLTLQRMVPGMTAKTIEQVTKACARAHNAVLDLQLDASDESDVNTAS